MNIKTDSLFSFETVKTDLEHIIKAVEENGKVL